jgi:hypothetical protein
MVLVLVAVEIQSFRQGRTVISRRRLLLRLLAGVLLLTLLAAVFVGLFVLRLESGRGRPQLFLIYWSSCLLIAIVLVWVMLADLQNVEDLFTERQREIWRDMERFVAHQLGPPTPPDSGSPPQAGKSENPE